MFCKILAGVFAVETEENIVRISIEVLEKKMRRLS
jgi:hypothetical protein